MSVTVCDDGWLRTHDDAHSLLKYVALGATVMYPRLGKAKTLDALGATREFLVVLDGAPGFSVNSRDLYSLPCRADALALRVRAICDAGKRALARHMTVCNS